MTLEVAGSKPVVRADGGLPLPWERSPVTNHGAGFGFRLDSSAANRAGSSAESTVEGERSLATEVAGSTPAPRTMENSKETKLYILVRADLSPGLQIAQSCHALRAFAAAHPDADRTWFANSNNIVALSVPDEATLARTLAESEATGALVARFTEPDLDDELTAGAVLGAARRLLQRLPLALAA